MSQLTLCEIADEPQILSFQDFASHRRTQSLTAVERARAEFHNRACPICCRSTVEPIELKNGRLGRNGRMVPGTGTLVGFSCTACGHEWPA